MPTEKPYLWTRQETDEAYQRAGRAIKIRLAREAAATTTKGKSKPAPVPVTDDEDAPLEDYLAMLDPEDEPDQDDQDEPDQKLEDSGEESEDSEEVCLCECGPCQRGDHGKCSNPSCEFPGCKHDPVPEPEDDEERYQESSGAYRGADRGERGRIERTLHKMATDYARRNAVSYSLAYSVVVLEDPAGRALFERYVQMRPSA